MRKPTPKRNSHNFFRFRSRRPPHRPIRKNVHSRTLTRIQSPSLEFSLPCLNPWKGHSQLGVRSLYGADSADLKMGSVKKVEFVVIGLFLSIQTSSTFENRHCRMSNTLFTTSLSLERIDINMSIVGWILPTSAMPPPQKPKEKEAAVRGIVHRAPASWVRAHAIRQCTAHLENCFLCSAVLSPRGADHGRTARSGAQLELAVRTSAVPMPARSSAPRKSSKSHRRPRGGCPLRPSRAPGAAGLLAAAAAGPHGRSHRADDHSPARRRWRECTQVSLRTGRAKWPSAGIQNDVESDRLLQRGGEERTPSAARAHASS
jgi:hypothetical protein